MCLYLPKGEMLDEIFYSETLKCNTQSLLNASVIELLDIKSCAIWGLTQSG